MTQDLTPVPDTATARDYWTEFAPCFQSHLEPTTVKLASILHDHLRLETATSVLEVGAGAGEAARRLTFRMVETRRLVVTDLSPEMVRRARIKLPPHVEVEEADCVALPYDDSTFDRYISNLSLMLVPDARLAVEEARRVLAPGGRAAWSVWGRPEHSPMMTIVPRAAEAVGVTLPQAERSNFYLGAPGVLVELLRNAGFQHVRTWYVPMVLDVLTGEECVRVLLEGSPYLQGALADKPRQQVDALRERATLIAQGVLDRGEAIALEAMVAIAER